MLEGPPHVDGRPGRRHQMCARAYPEPHAVANAVTNGTAHASTLASAHAVTFAFAHASPYPVAYAGSDAGADCAAHAFAVTRANGRAFAEPDAGSHAKSNTGPDAGPDAGADAEPNTCVPSWHASALQGCNVEWRARPRHVAIFLRRLQGWPLLRRRKRNELPRVHAREALHQPRYGVPRVPGWPLQPVSWARGLASHCRRYRLPRVQARPISDLDRADQLLPLWFWFFPGQVRLSGLSFVP